MEADCSAADGLNGWSSFELVFCFTSTSNFLNGCLSFHVAAYEFITPCIFVFIEAIFDS